MIRSAPAHCTFAARMGLSVPRLLAGLGLVLVLLMGSWVETHSETDGLTAPSTAGPIVADQSGAVPAAVTTAGGNAENAEDLGVALCLLGVACALALVVLAWRAPSRTFSVERVAGIVRERIAVPSSRNPVLTLTQLRVFRT